MKRLQKICVAAICCSMMLGITALPVSAAEYICGDVNGDKKVTVADVILIQRKLLGVSTGYFNSKAADVDGKGLKLSDAIQVQRYLVGYGSNPYHVGSYVDEYELPFIPI